MKASPTLILLFISLLFYSCTDRFPELEFKVLNIEQSSNLETLTYDIQAKEKNNICGAKSVEFVLEMKVTEESDIDPAKFIFTGEIFGSVSRGETLQKTYTYETSGREIDIEGVKIDEIGFDGADCIESTPF